MKTIEVSMTQLHRKLAQYIELARGGNYIVVVVNKLRGRVECHITAPLVAYWADANTLTSDSEADAEADADAEAVNHE